MDTYTQLVKKQLDTYYSRTDKDGIYIGNQPIYGFRKDEPRNGLIINYIRMYQIANAVAAIKAHSLIDVGGGEGYTAFVCQQLCGLDRVLTTDISSQACKRAKEIFHLQSYEADAVSLPFPEESFDIALSSETIEHIPNWQQAVLELVRVAKKAVVITVPHESETLIQKSRQQNIPGDHINAFTLNSFDFVKEKGVKAILKKKMLSSLMTFPNTLVDASPRWYNQFYERAGYPRWVIETYNHMVPGLKRIFNQRVAEKMVYLDEMICKLIPVYDSMVFILIKDQNSLLKQAHDTITVKAVMDVIVPYYHLKQPKT